MAVVMVSLSESLSKKRADSAISLCRFVPHHRGDDDSFILYLGERILVR